MLMAGIQLGIIYKSMVWYIYIIYRMYIYIYIYIYIHTHSVYKGLVFKGFPPHFKGLEESLILDRFSLKKIKAVC